MSNPAKPPLSEKERRALALQKALRDNLRRRKTAASDAADSEATDDPSSGDVKQDF